MINASVLAFIFQIVCFYKFFVCVCKCDICDICDIYIYMFLHHYNLPEQPPEVVLCEEYQLFNFYCSTVHFDNIKILFTNKCTLLLNT